MLKLLVILFIIKLYAQINVYNSLEMLCVHQLQKVFRSVPQTLVNKQGIFFEGFKYRL